MTSQDWSCDLRCNHSVIVPFRVCTKKQLQIFDYWLGHVIFSIIWIVHCYCWFCDILFLLYLGFFVGNVFGSMIIRTNSDKMHTKSDKQLLEQRKAMFISNFLYETRSTGTVHWGFVNEWTKAIRLVAVLKIGRKLCVHMEMYDGKTSPQLPLWCTVPTVKCDHKIELYRLPFSANWFCHGGGEYIDF
jgi:hypothetical protein